MDKDLSNYAEVLDCSGAHVNYYLENNYELIAVMSTSRMVPFRGGDSQPNWDRAYLRQGFVYIVGRPKGVVKAEWPTNRGT